MRMIILLLVGLMFVVPINSNAGQTEDPVLIRIADWEITRTQFEEIYRKNNLESMVVDPKEVDEYLEMYINFRLKVMEAKNVGLDTNTSFIEELNGYRGQLARKYLFDNEVTEQLIEEAWERSQYDIRVSHILMELDAHAPPEDTVVVYQKMMEVRQRILKGESFADLARELSNDPSARDREATAGQPARRGNAGDLGYFSVFHMVYPFETAAYNTPVGEISMPFRTNFGYHIIKVTDRLPAMGRARVAHIMLMTPVEMEKEELIRKEKKIHDIHKKLLDGEDFGELASEFSEDRQSAQRKGEMQPFTSNRMVPQFIKAISELQEAGDYSSPVRSDFGWHIIQLIEKTPPPPYEEAYTELHNRLQRDARSQLGQEAVIKRIKKEYMFQEDLNALRKLYKVVDETIFEGQWEMSEANLYEQMLFSFDSTEFTLKDFKNYLFSNQRKQEPQNIPSYIYMQYQRFVDEKILEYEDARLEEKYPEFNRVMQEYRDGMLLFEITNEKVWSKATSDTTGLKSYFEENKDRYQADELREVRGIVIADYQNYLEKQWVTTLRDKYEIWIDFEVLETITFD